MDVANTGGGKSQISICTLLTSSSSLAGLLSTCLEPNHYQLFCTDDSKAFMDSLVNGSDPIDCLMVEDPVKQASLFAQLVDSSILLPTVVLTKKGEAIVPPQDHSESTPYFFYHPAELRLSSASLEDLPFTISQAIANFLRLSAIARSDRRQSFQAWFAQPTLQEKLREQQLRLSEKLKERLGYLGVYYKRDPQQFIRNLEKEDRQAVLSELKSNYRQIILGYFRDGVKINALLDEFVTKAFFADVSVTWLLEMHMEFMDIFAKQLKLEGRNDDVLLDYRLTLIDAIAHLCEMYRLSIPRDL